MESIKINKNYIQVNRIKACAVVMVMLIHFIGFGGFWENKNKNLYMILGLMINVLIVNCVPFFYMLTGYLDKTYTYDKVLKKILMIISVYLLYCIPVILVYRFQYNDVSWTVERYISCVLRIDAINNREGFIRGYIIMMLIAPLINQYFDKTTINSIRKITFSSLFIFSIGEVLEYWFHCSLFITAPAKYTNAIMFFIIGNWLSRENLKSMKYKCAIGMIGAFIINVIVFFTQKT